MANQNSTAVVADRSIITKAESKRLLRVFRDLPPDVKRWIKIYEDAVTCCQDIMAPDGFDDALQDAVLGDDRTVRVGEPRTYDVPDCADQAWLAEFLPELWDSYWAQQFAPRGE